MMLIITKDHKDKTSPNKKTGSHIGKAGSVKIFLNNEQDHYQIHRNRYGAQR